MTPGLVCLPFNFGGLDRITADGLGEAQDEVKAHALRTLLRKLGT
jgi:hypothetical protein